MSTIRAHKKRIEGLTVAICGDVRHSRVARSNIHALQKLGARVRVAGPRTLMPVGIEGLGGKVDVFDRLEPALEGADVVMMLRIQKERLAGLEVDLADYVERYQLRAERLPASVVVMHPGPMIRGLEIADEVADGPQSAIEEQVSHGLAVRIALLVRALGVHA